MQTQFSSKFYSIGYTIQQHRSIVLALVILLSLFLAFVFPQLVLAEDSCGGSVCPL